LFAFKYSRAQPSKDISHSNVQERTTSIRPIEGHGIIGDFGTKSSDESPSVCDLVSLLTCAKPRRGHAVGQGFDEKSRLEGNQLEVGIDPVLIKHVNVLQIPRSSFYSELFVAKI
jgi:hypothetical protein